MYIICNAARQAKYISGPKATGWYKGQRYEDDNGNAMERNESLFRYQHRYLNDFESDSDDDGDEDDDDDAKPDPRASSSREGLTLFSSPFSVM